MGYRVWFVNKAEAKTIKSLAEATKIWLNYRGSYKCLHSQDSCKVRAACKCHKHHIHLDMVPWSFWIQAIGYCTLLCE